MRPEFDNEIMRAAMPGARPGIKSIPFDAWRQLDSSAPSTPQTSNPSIIRARSIGAGATAPLLKALFHLEKPATGWSGDRAERRSLLFNDFGYLGNIFSVNNPGPGSSLQAVSIAYGVKAILSDFDPDLATWDNKVASPDVTYSAAQYPGTSVFDSPIEIPTDFDSSDVQGPGATSVYFAQGVTNIMTKVGCGIFVGEEDWTVYGFLVEAGAGTTSLTNWWSTFGWSVQAPLKGPRGPRIEW